MPNGASIFETTGAWEDFATPSRDLRLLIAMDVVRGFPDRVARRSERYAMPQGKSAADVKAELERVLATELSTRKFSYTRTDGSAWTLAFKDVPVILLYHQLASWAMKKGIAYSARTDEYTFAHDFRPQQAAQPDSSVVFGKVNDQVMLASLERENERGLGPNLPQRTEALPHAVDGEKLCNVRVPAQHFSGIAIDQCVYLDMRRMPCKAGKDW